MGYWGYPWANGSAYGNPWGGVGYGYPTSIGAPAYGASYGASLPDASQGADAGAQSQQTGGIKGFFKGIAQGAVNTIKGIFTPQGLLMLGGTVALTVLTGGAILPLLGAVGIGVGGYQVLKGVANGDTEQMGEGVFSLGLSALGFMGPKLVTVKGANGTSTTYQLMSKSGGKGGFFDQVKSLFGKRKYEAGTIKVATDGAKTFVPLTGAEAKSLNMYQLSLEKAKSFIKKKPSASQSESAVRTSGNPLSKRQVKITQKINGIDEEIAAVREARANLGNVRSEDLPQMRQSAKDALEKLGTIKKPNSRIGQHLAKLQTELSKLLAAIRRKMGYEDIPSSSVSPSRRGSTGGDQFSRMDIGDGSTYQSSPISPTSSTPLLNPKQHSRGTGYGTFN